MNRDQKGLRVLCLDIEGGYGGSSRSLYFTLKHIDRSLISPSVWCKKSGVIQQRYQQLNFPCEVHNSMPSVSSLSRLSRNIYVYLKYISHFLKSKKFHTLLLNFINQHVDVVHFNHEGLFLLAKWLRNKTSIPFVMHIRTRPVNTVFSRWQAKNISKCIDRLVFITENERDHFRLLGGNPSTGEVIYNVVEPAEKPFILYPKVPNDSRIKVCSLSNFSLERGTDRLLDIAQSLRRKNRYDVLFVVAGDMSLTRSMPGILGKTAKKRGTFADVIKKCDLQGYFLFLGHVSNPEQVIASCDVLIKPARGNNPWGRDIIEAMSFDKPVIATGRYDVFVVPGKTGYLFSEFDPDKFAERIIEFAENKIMMQSMGKEAGLLVRRLCRGPDKAEQLAKVWMSANRHEM